MPLRQHQLAAPEELGCHPMAEVGRRPELHHYFWLPFMVPASALFSRKVRRAELIENLFMCHVDICGVLESGLQAKVRMASSDTASNHLAWPCQPYKEARLRWGGVPFFTGAPLHARAFVPACAC